MNFESYYLTEKAAKNVGNIKIDVNGSIFNFTFDSLHTYYALTLNFTSTEDFPFSIYGNSSYPNFTGTFLVRHPFYIKFCGFENKGKNKYVNDFAYLTAEFTTYKQYYDSNLELFFSPFTMNILGGGTTSTIPVFHSSYSDGCGTLKLYEPNKEYAIRLLDGEIIFKTTFSIPNITKSYGTNSYIGKYFFDGIDISYNLMFSNKDINQYGWLFNWTAIICIVLALATSIIMLFMFPQYPIISIAFFTIVMGGTIILRVIIWFYLG